MPPENVNNPMPGIINGMAQRPLTGNAPVAPAQAPAPAPAYAPPTDRYAQQPAAPNAPMPKDPEQQAIFGVYALTLNSTNPVEVSQAISVLENLGPAFRADAINAVRNQLFAGGDPMKSKIVMDALVRWQSPTLQQDIQRMMTDPDPGVRAEAGKIYQQFARQTVGPASVPGTPNSPTANQQGVDPVLVQSYVEKFKNWQTMPTAAFEAAQLPTQQLSAITIALANDPTFDQEKAFDLLSQALAKKIKEPGALEAMRAILNRPPEELNSREMAFAKTRAAVATLHFGSVADQAGYLKLLTQKHYMRYDLKKMLIDQLVSRPDLAQTQAAIVTLGAVANDDGAWDAGLAAMHALSKIKTPLARDVMGESLFWKQSFRPSKERNWALDWLKQHPKPYSAGTIANLRWLADNAKADAEAAKKAKELLK